MNPSSMKSRTKKKVDLPGKKQHVFKGPKSNSTVALVKQSIIASAVDSGSFALMANVCIDKVRLKNQLAKILRVIYNLMSSSF